MPLIIFVLFLLSFHSLQAAECVEGQAVTLTGTLSEKTFAGPPNYESIQAGDTPETYVIAALNPGSCVDSQQVQLVFTGTHTPHILQRLYGKPVSLTGTLFEAQTGHHHTPFLMEVSAVDATVTKQPGREYHEVLEQDLLSLSVLAQGKEVYRHTLIHSQREGDVLAVELGDYKINGDNLTLYSYWDTTDETQSFPKGARKQVVHFNTEGQAEQKFGEISIHVGKKSDIARKTGDALVYVLVKEPPEKVRDNINLFYRLIKEQYQAEFLARADESADLSREVMSVLKKSIDTFTKDWK